MNAPSSFPPDIDWPLVQRVVVGSATADDRARVAQWIGTDQTRATFVESLQRVWAESDAMPARFDTAGAWELARRRLALGRSLPPRSPQEHAPRRTARSRLRRAGESGSIRTPRINRIAVAYCAGALAAGVIATVATVDVRRSAARAPAATYAAAPGQRKTVTLPDGTQFTLAPASRLTVARDYGRNRRDVRLDGEAYFTVAHDPSRPFIVRAANAVVTDIGTRFDVRAYAGDAESRVAVAEGRVALGPARSPDRTSPIVLTAGEISGVDAHNRITAPARGDVATLTSWTHGVLELHDVPLGDAIPELVRWYNVNIRLADPALSGLRLTVSLRDTPATDAVTLIAATLGLVATNDGQTIRLGARTPRR